MLLQECNKLGLLSDSSTTTLTSKRYRFLSHMEHTWCRMFHEKDGIKLILRLAASFWFCHFHFNLLISFTLFTFIQSHTYIHTHTMPPPSSPPWSSVPLPLHTFFRTEDREFAPRLKTAENANIQPNPGLILRAEPTVTNILKVKHSNLI